MASSSFDYGYMKLSAMRRPFNYSESNRRLSWDDFTVFYQTANDWDYPVDEVGSEQSNKSQNPSPKHDANMNIHRVISPLSTGMPEQNGSETDEEETSVSSMDDDICCKSINKQYGHNMFKKQGSRNSLEDMLDTDDDYAEQDSSISVPHDDINGSEDEIEYNNNTKNHRNMDIANGDNNDMDAISISLSNYDSNEEEEEERQRDNEKKRNQKEDTHHDKEMRLVSMELKVNDLNETISILMERIQELSDRNKYLEISKLKLIHNTANAMNEYRDTIKQLNQQNNILLNRIKR